MFFCGFWYFNYKSFLCLFFYSCVIRDIWDFFIFMWYFKNGFIVKKIINYIIYVYIYWIFEVIYLGIIKIMEVYVNVN